MKTAAAMALLLSQLMLAGCDRPVRDMDAQPRLDHGDTSPLWSNGLAMRAPPPGSVPQSAGPLAATSSGRQGTDLPLQRTHAEAQQRLPAVPERAQVLRGQDRYTIYCTPCHSPLGDGRGPIVLRGFPAPPSLHLPRLREAPDRHLYDVITQGHGVMTAYGDRLTPDDRWAVVAYLRVLQASQHWPLERLPQALRSQLPPPPEPPR